MTAPTSSTPQTTPAYPLTRQEAPDSDEAYKIIGQTGSFNIQLSKTPRPEQQRVHALFHEAIDTNHEINIERLNEVFLEYNRKQIDQLNSSSDETASLFVFQGSANREHETLETMDFKNKRVILTNGVYGDGTYHTSDFENCYCLYAKHHAFLSVMKIKIKKNDVDWIQVPKEGSIDEKTSFLYEKAKHGPLPKDKGFRIMPDPDTLTSGDDNERGHFWVIASPNNEDEGPASTSFAKVTPVYIFEVNTQFEINLSSLKRNLNRLKKKISRGKPYQVANFLEKTVSLIGQLKSMAQNSATIETSEAEGLTPIRQLEALESNVTNVTQGDPSYLLSDECVYDIIGNPGLHEGVLASIYSKLSSPDLIEREVL